MYVACDNAYTPYNMMHQSDLILFDYKTIVSTHLIGQYKSCSRAPPEQKAGSKRQHQYLSSHLPVFQHSQKCCDYCHKEELDRKTFVECT